MIDKIDASQLNTSEPTPEFSIMPGFPAPPGAHPDPALSGFPAPPGLQINTSQLVDPVPTITAAPPEDPVEKENLLSNEKDNINI
jgi:hypothetical protein